jgi:hypothetical protein
VHRTHPSQLAAGAALLVLIGLAGCTPSAPTPSPHTSNTPSPPQEDDGRITVDEYTHLANVSNGLQIVEPDVGISVPWVVIAKNDRSTTLFVAFPARIPDKRDCGHHIGVAITESDTEVLISARSTRPKLFSGCTESPVIGGGYINLRDPIGDRRLMHDVVNAPWADAPPPIATRPGPTPTPAPSLPPDYAGPATCDSLLSPQTLTRLRSQGYLDDSDFTDKIKSEPELRQLYAMLQYGGFVCRRIQPADTAEPSSSSFAWSPITAAQADAQKALLAPSSTSTTVDGITRVSSVPAGAQYAFGDGWWVACYDNGGGALLEDLIANRPR